MSEFKSRPSISRILLWIPVAFVLAYYAFIASDFFAHPFAAGTNTTVGAPYLFRWLSFVAGTFTVIVSLFIMSRVRGNVVGPLLLIYGVGAAGWSGRLEWETVTQLAWLTAVFELYFYALALPAVIGMFFYFPTGHAYPPRLERWVPLFCISMVILGVFVVLGTPPAQQSGVPNPLYIPLLEPLGNLYGVLSPFALLAALVTVFLRYRHGGTRERLQLKWVLWLGGMVIAITMIIGFIPADAVSGLLGAKMPAILRVIAFILWQSFAAVAFGLAILRYRLWDIDLIIRRTLQYSVLSALLALVYFGGVVVLQRIFTSLTGQGQNQLVTVLSTLAIAALFNPVRRRVQDVIDRRFYRKKYDAAKTLAAFAATVRDETDLDKLAASLIAVVQETMQPEHVSLWLKDSNATMLRRNPCAGADDAKK